MGLYVKANKECTVNEKDTVCEGQNEVQVEKARMQVPLCERQIEITCTL